jgi:hypothetical protein
MRRLSTKKKKMTTIMHCLRLCQENIVNVRCLEEDNDNGPSAVVVRK